MKLTRLLTHFRVRLKGESPPNDDYSLSEIALQQTRAINWAIDYRNRILRRDADPSTSELAYLETAIWTGFANPNLGKHSQRKFELNFAIFKNRYRIVTHCLFSPVYEVVNGKDFLNHLSPQTIVISWASKEDFAPEGNHFDNYLGTQSAPNDTFYWILIVSDGHAPKSLSSNITVIAPLKSSLFCRAVTILKRCIASIVRCRFNSTRFLHDIGTRHDLTNAVFKAINSVNLDSAQTLVMPYESQFFQNQAAKHFKKVKEGKKVVGILHSALPALPSEFLFPGDMIDKLIVSGDDQQAILTTQLGWPSDRITVLPSLRFRISDRGPETGTLILPWDISNLNTLLGQLNDEDLCMLSSLQPRLHPDYVNNENYLAEVSIFNTILNLHRDEKTNKDNKVLAVYGSTSLLLNLLENGYTVIQMTLSPVSDVYHPDTWTHIKIVQSDRFIYKYHIHEKEKIIKSSDDDYNLHSVLKTL